VAVVQSQLVDLFNLEKRVPERLPTTGGVGNIPTTWTLVSTGDFDGDGMSDVLWRDSSGNTSIWYMNRHRSLRRRASAQTRPRRRLLRPAISAAMASRAAQGLPTYRYPV
jgi:hypothetical protein